MPFHLPPAKPQSTAEAWPPVAVPPSEAMSSCSQVLRRTNGSRLQAALCCQLHDRRGGDSSGVSKHGKAAHQSTWRESQVLWCGTDFCDALVTPRVSVKKFEQHFSHSARNFACHNSSFWVYLGEMSLDHINFIALLLSIRVVCSNCDGREI